MKQIIRHQYQSKTNQSYESGKLLRPQEGWVRTVRKALGMSSPQLGKVLGISKSQASQMERMEMDDRITLKQLRRAAEALGCELTYSLVPQKPVEELVRERAKIKAQKLIAKADVQMKLEAQQLPREQLEKQTQQEVERLIYEMPRDLWED